MNWLNRLRRKPAEHVGATLGWSPTRELAAVAEPADWDTDAYEAHAARQFRISADLIEANLHDRLDDIDRTVKAWLRNERPVKVLVNNHRVPRSAAHIPVLTALWP